MIRLSLEEMPILFTSGPGVPSTFIINGEDEPPTRLTELIDNPKLLLFINLTCCVTEAVTAKTVSKLTVSAERKRRALTF
jgi:hypothetical protein